MGKYDRPILRVPGLRYLLLRLLIWNLRRKGDGRLEAYLLACKYMFWPRSGCVQKAKDWVDRHWEGRP